MLKKFFMNALSSFVGAWVAILLLGAVVTIVVLGIAGSDGHRQRDCVREVQKCSRT